MRRVSVEVLVIAALLTFSLNVLVNLPNEVSALTPHSTIYINGNADFTAPNGVTGGSGTWDDPYIIDGWEIDSSTDHGIKITNSSAHFIIQDCYAHGSKTKVGFLLINVTNGLAHNVTSYNNTAGIQIISSDNSTVSNNTAYENIVQIFLTYSSTNVTGNTLWGGDQGIFLYRSNYTNITENKISFVEDGITYYRSHDDRTTWNDIEATKKCIRQLYSFDNLFGNNTLRGGEHGHYLRQSSGNRHYNESVGSRSDAAIYLEYSNSNSFVGVDDYGMESYVARIIDSSQTLIAHVKVHWWSMEGLSLVRAHNATLRHLDLTSRTFKCVEITDSSNVTLENSTLTVHSRAVRIRDSTDIRIMDNRLRPRGSVMSRGIDVVNCTSCEASGNIIRNAVGNALKVAESSIDVLRNTVVFTETGNVSTGMLFERSTVVVANNSVSNVMKGIELVDSLNANISGNFIVNCDYGVYLQNASSGTYIGNNSFLANALYSAYSESPVTVQSNYFGTTNLSAIDVMVHDVSYGSPLSADRTGANFTHATGNVSWTGSVEVDRGVVVEGNLYIRDADIVFNNSFSQNFVVVEGKLYIRESSFSSQTGYFTIQKIGNPSMYAYGSTFSESRALSFVTSNVSGSDLAFDSAFRGIIAGNAPTRIRLNGLTIDAMLEAVILRKSPSEITYCDISSLITGIKLISSEHSLIEGNTVTGFGEGIEMTSSPHSQVLGNTLIVPLSGVRLHNSSNVTIAGNTVSWSRPGIDARYSSGLSIRDNLITSGGGIRMIGVSNSMTERNRLAGTNDGIEARDSDYNVIRFNSIENTWNYGVGLTNSRNNRIFHNNFIDNADQAYDDTDMNQWDDGYPFGGNYWSDYSGLDDKRGPNQDEPGSDGIGDTPYTIDVDSRDRYPLMNPLGEFIPPKIDFVLINGLSSQTYILPDVPPLVLTAILDDRDTGGSRIGGANLTVGVHNWSSSSRMHASDGSFDSPYEVAYAEVSSPTEPGNYDYCVSAWDADFNFNSTSTACARLTLMALPSHPVMHDAVLSGSGLRDVTISWIASPDDGAGEDDIAGYFVRRSTSYAGPYIRIAGFPANGSAMYEWTCIGCGKDNPNNYFFYVEATDSILSTPSPNRVGKFTRPLASGPNLVSIPVIISNESIEHILQTVRWNKAWSYHSLSHEWKWFTKDKTYSRGLLSANYTMGLWVNITSDCNLTMAGMVPAQTTIQLYSGWNLVSFPSFNTTYTVADLKAEIGATRVEGYDFVPPNYLRVLGDAGVLQAGYGYWVKVEADTVWTVSFE